MSFSTKKINENGSHGAAMAYDVDLRYMFMCMYSRSILLLNLSNSLYIECMYTEMS